MPKLSQEVKDRLSACDRQLETLPPIVTMEPVAYVIELITSFCNAVRLHIQGERQAAEIVQLNRKAYAEFKQCIRSTAPNFKPFSDDQEGLSSTLEDIADDDEREEISIREKKESPLYLCDVRKHIQQ